MKTYILYHGNCPDGFGAATAAWLKLGDAAEYIPVNYGKPMPTMDDESKVFIVDFSYPRKQLIELAVRMERTVVLDHHTTAQQDLDGLQLPGDESEIIFDMEKSGAVLAWEYFHGEDVPEFMLYLQDRDLWRFDLPLSREVSYALRSYPMVLPFWGDMVCHAGTIAELKREGIVCVRLTNQMVDAMTKHHRWAYLDPKARTIRFTEKLEPGGAGDSMVPEHVKIIPVANATVFFSEVGERLLEMYPAMDCAAYYSDRSDGKQQWGLRSRPSCDCSVIAKAFGGGGHKQASGFVFEVERHR